jgi:hypothetical protein
VPAIQPKHVSTAFQYFHTHTKKDEFAIPIHDRHHKMDNQIRLKEHLYNSLKGPDRLQIPKVDRFLFFLFSSDWQQFIIKFIDLWLFQVDARKK